MGVGMRELVVIFLIALLLFGAKRVRSLGSDLGSAIRSFRREVDRKQQDDPVATAGAEECGRRAERPEASKTNSRIQID